MASVVLGIGLLATPGSLEPRGRRRPGAPGVLADIVHLGGVSVWLGGLAAMALVVLRRRRGHRRAGGRAAVLDTAALWAVGVIVASGAFHTWRQVGSVRPLTETTFGRLLIMKLVLYAGLVALGALGRRRRQRADAARTASMLLAQWPRR